MTINELINTDQEFQYILFWDHTEGWQGVSKVCLSQWYESIFESQGQVYVTAEQYMMAEKARLMGDEEAREKILASENPQKAKKFGRQVQNYDQALWDKHKYAVVVAGNYNKFSQNKALRNFLLSTGDAILVEASPFDIIWGIGMDAEDPDARNPKKWKGKNLLGFALMEVRRMLKDEFGKYDTSKIGDGDCDAKQLISYWTHGLGNMSAIFNGEDGMPSKEKVCTASSWQIEHMPDSHVDIPLEIYLPTKFTEIIKRGHKPEDMSDHWFMYCDEATVRYYRSWTGHCIFIARYEVLGDITRLSSLRVNRNPKQYRGRDPEKDIAQFMALLTLEYGGYAGDYWVKVF